MSNYRIEVFSRLHFTNLKNAERLKSLYLRTMKDLGLDTDGHYHSNRWANSNLFKKREGRDRHQLHLNFTHRSIPKAKAEKLRSEVINIMTSLTKRFGFNLESRDVKSYKHKHAGVLLNLGWNDDDGVYFELERMMNTRIDCCIGRREAA